MFNIDFHEWVVEQEYKLLQTTEEENLEFCICAVF